jgi:hypothetical protein
VNVLVDTAVWSLALRRKSGDLNKAEKVVVAELTEIIQEGRARMIGLVRQELLSSIKTEAQYEALRLLLRSFPDESISQSTRRIMRRSPGQTTFADQDAWRFLLWTVFFAPWRLTADGRSSRPTRI